MTTTPKQTLKPFAEIFEIDTSGTDSVAIWSIPAGTIITRVLAKIKTAGSGSGNLTIGDDDDPDGYILAGDATAAADTIYGDTPEELGAYLYMGVSYHSEKWKQYTSAKTLYIDCSGALTTEATVDVFVFGYRYYED
jgi:hypothetical protein